MSAVWSRYSKSKPGTAWAREKEVVGVEVEVGFSTPPAACVAAAAACCSLSIPSSSSSLFASSSLVLLALAPCRGPRGVTAAGGAAKASSCLEGGRSVEASALVVVAAVAVAVVAACGNSSSALAPAPAAFPPLSPIATGRCFGCRLEALGGRWGRDWYWSVVILKAMFSSSKTL